MRKDEYSEQDTILSSHIKELPKFAQKNMLKTKANRTIGEVNNQY